MARPKTGMHANRYDELSPREQLEIGKLINTIAAHRGQEKDRPTDDGGRAERAQVEAFTAYDQDSNDKVEQDPLVLALNSISNELETIRAIVGQTTSTQAALRIHRQLDRLFEDVDALSLSTLGRADKLC